MGLRNIIGQWQQFPADPLVVTDIPYVIEFPHYVLPIIVPNDSGFENYKICPAGTNRFICHMTSTCTIKKGTCDLFIGF